MTNIVRMYLSPTLYPSFTQVTFFLKNKIKHPLTDIKKKGTKMDQLIAESFI